MKKERPRVLVTGAGGSAGANVISSLALSGKFDLVGADSDARRLHLSPAGSNVLIPRVEKPDYLDALNNCVSEERIDVVHFQPDPEVLFASENADSIQAALFLPPYDAVAMASDKADLNRVLQQRGVLVPFSQATETMSDLREKVDLLLETNPKVWVRAKQGAGSRASLPVSSSSQAEAWVNWWTAEKSLDVHNFMVSEFLPGREFAFQSVWQNGRLITGQARQRVEYLYGFLSPSGQSSTPSIAKTVSDPRIDELAIKAIKALIAEPHGVFCVDMKENIHGLPCVTEINVGRFFTTSNFFSEAGLNMPEMAVNAALGEPLEEIGTSTLERDLYWIRMVDMGYKLVKGGDLEPWKNYSPPTAGS